MVGLKGVVPDADPAASAGAERTAPRREGTVPQRITLLWERHRSKALAVLAVALGTGAVLWHQHFYGPFFTDDGFISLRYTERLLQGKGLTWTDNERVEGYSNLLWVLLCAVPGLFGVNLLAGARAMGALCTAATLGAVVAAMRPTRPIQWLGTLVVMGFFAASDSIAVWSMGGLESPLVGALLSSGIVAAVASARDGNQRATLAAAACFGLVCWARVDAALWAVAAVAGIALGWRKRGVRTCIAIAGGALACVTAQLLFRLAYYHDYIANTAYAKVAINDDRLNAGIEHLESSLLPLAGTWLALLSAGAYGLRHARLRGLSIFHLTLALAWTAYMVRIGGDIFPAWRLLTYDVVVAGMFLAFVLGDDLRSAVAPAGLRWAVALVTLGALGSHFNPKNWAKEEVWQWDGVVVGRTLARMFHDEQPLVAVDAAGTIPYSSKFPALDMLGLTDRYLAHHRPKNMGAGFMGHELGDASYYAERAPDIVCFGVPPCQHPGKFPAQKEWVARRDFRQHYAALNIEAGNGQRTLTAALWIRRDGRIGIRSTPTSIFVPSYFLASSDGAIARLSSAGTVEAVLPARARPSIEHVALPAGHWQFEVQSANGSGTVTLSAGGRVVASGDARTRLEFSVAEATTLDITLAIAPGSFFTTSGLRLARTESP